MDLEGANARQLYQAVIEDAKAGRWGRMDLLSYGTAREEWLTINLELRRPYQDDPDRGDYVNLHIIYTPAMTATARALLDAGLNPQALEPPAMPQGGGEVIVP